MTMDASAHHAALVREDPEDAILAALARLPVGGPLTRKEAARIAQGEAYVAAGGRGRPMGEVIAAARARSPR
jgi:hypothetical protein